MVFFIFLIISNIQFSLRKYMNIEKILGILKVIIIPISLLVFPIQSFKKLKI